MHFTPRELARVGAAATMMVFGGTAIIILVMVVLGHYNSLAHSGPKAVLDGAVIALLIGQRGRWRCLGLLGVVYGLVLLIQVGVPYLPLVLATAGGLAMAVGGSVGAVHRRLGVLLAAAVYEWAAGLGSPLKIYFGTVDANEPFLWGMWFAEWPLRIVGAWIGVMLAWRWVSRRSADPAAIAQATASQPLARSAQVAARGPASAALRLAMLLLSSIVPLALQSWTALVAVTALVLIYAIVVGRPRTVLHTLMGVVWGWIVFAAASYLWHRDPQRVIDLVRTFALRFAPMALASAVLITTTRPVDLIRVLRRLYIPGVVLIPLATVVRQIPHARRDVAHGLAHLRQTGHWRGPLSLLRHPRPILATLLFRPLQRWAGQLAE